MNRTMFTAAIAALALTATAADARQSARERGVASGQEARERAATKALNTQQMSAQAGVGSPMGQTGQMGAPDSAAMPMGSTATTDQGAAAAAAPMASIATPETGNMAQTSQMAPANDPVAAPGPASPTGDMAGGTHDSSMAGMSHGSSSTMSTDGMMMTNGKWMMGDRPATKAEIKAHKDMMKQEKMSKPM